ncbi:uncharacterized protein LOC120082123 [Benincasa hispida]|uniref:uncharacterized protein LOC120082123 n=1 Tax=Benincasa hispida TaxID=102211 RepID=UPI00190102FE|nr:uncharacterized protein LOC120082123 [Benincasa hispida]
MALLRIFVRFGGDWDESGRNYVGGHMKGLKIRNDITVSELVSMMHQRLNIGSDMFDIYIKCCYKLLVPASPIDIVDDEDLSFFLEGSEASQMPLFVSVTPVNSHGVHQHCNPTDQPNPIHTMSSIDDHIEPCNLGDDRNEAWFGWNNEPRCTSQFNTKHGYGQTSSTPNIHVPTPHAPVPLVVMPSALMHFTVPIEPFVDIPGPLEGPSYDNLVTIPHDCLNDEDIKVGQIFFLKYDLSVKLSMLAIRKNFDYHVKKSTKSLLTVRVRWRNARGGSVPKNERKWFLQSDQVSQQTYMFS